MKPNTIILEDDGLYCFEAPEKPDFQKTFASDNTYTWNKYLIDLKNYHDALEAAKKQKVKFKNFKVIKNLHVNTIIVVDGYEMAIEKGKLYPVPDGYEIKIEQPCKDGCESSSYCLDTCAKSGYAVLVPKQEPVVIVDSPDRTNLIINPVQQPASIEEAAGKYANEKWSYDIKLAEHSTSIKDFIAGAKSDAAKEYWFEKFKKEMK